MNWRAASRICAAIHKLAETGRGAEREASGGLRLRVPGAVAFGYMNVETKTVVVWRIFAVR
jgi:hypothetical protein